MAETSPALHKFLQARVRLLIQQPFFGELAFYLQPVEDADMTPPTMGTDGEKLYFHPEFIAKCSFPDTVFIVAHEIMHCVLDHQGRRAGRDPVDWNIACDYAANALLKDAGFEMPSTGLYDPRYANMTAEEIYNLLPHRSGKGRRPPQFDTVRDAPKSKDVENSDAPSQSDQWKNAVIQAANSARGQDKLPGGIARLVGEMTAVKTDWRLRLRQFAVEETKNDYSYMRLNRKMLAHGLFLPGMHSECMGTMAIVTDDSGSIGDKILQAFGNEIASIRDAVQPQRTIVISCDAAVNHVDDLEADDLFELKCHGGGGTDFRPPFKWLDEQGIQPACLVYLTDLEGPFPDSPPGYPVLWCATTNHIAPWGETLKVEE